MDYKVDGHSKI